MPPRMIAKRPARIRSWICPGLDPGWVPIFGKDHPRANGGVEKTKAPAECRRSVNESLAVRRLLTVLLDPRRAQAGKAVAVDRILPRQELFDRQGIAGAGLF